MAVEIQLRRDVAAQWTSVNPILAEGEVGIEKDTKKLKVGNGSDAWTSLAYFVGDFSALANQVSLLSGVVSGEISARVAKDDALSVAINTVSNAVSAETIARAILSTNYTSLVNRVSTNSAGGAGGSVTSAEVVSAVGTETSNRISSEALLSAAINTVSNALSNELSVRVTKDDVLSAAINTVSNAVSVLSTNYTSLVNRVSANSAVGGGGSVTSAKVQTASAAATSADAHANTVSARVVSVSAELASLVQIASAAATSADGHANTVSARLVSVSAELASLVQIASAAATSADGHANTVSARAASISAEVVSLAQSASATLETHINTVSNADSVHFSAMVNASTVGSLAAISLLQSAINTVSAGVNTVSNQVSVNLSAVNNASTVGSLAAISLMQSAINTVSNQVSVNLSAVNNASTIGSIAALSIAIANDASVSAAVMSTIATSLLGAGQFRVVTGAQAVVSTFPQKVSGMSLSIAANGVYDVQGQVLWTQSTAGSASAIFQFGMSINQAPTAAAFVMVGNKHAFGAVGTVSAQVQFAGVGAICATPSIMYSVKASVAASGTPVQTMVRFEGVLVAGGLGGILKCLVGASTTSNTGINVIAGSYVRAFKIG